MYLTSYNLCEYLISKRLITLESVVDGDFRLMETGRRNRNFKIVRKRDPGLFVKQIRTSAPDALVTLRKEAAFYGMLGSSPQLRDVAGLAPSYVYYDPNRYVLVLNLFPEAESISETHLRNCEFPPDVARELAGGVALYHSVGPRIPADAATQHILPRQHPFIFTLGSSGASAVLAAVGTIGAKLAEAIDTYYPGLLPAIGQLKNEYQFDSLIHGDMKWENCILLPNQPKGSRLRVVDWELSDIGDGAWDLASLLKEYIMFWIMSLRHLSTGAGFQLPKEIAPDHMHSSIQAFWESYRTARGFAPDAAQKYLDRAIKFCAARLIIAIIEYLSGTIQMTQQAFAVLQVSWHMLQDPARAQKELFGIPTSVYATHS
jgi:hypothetical protein